MAKNHGAANHHVTTQIKDENGNIILEIGMREYMVTDSNHNTTIHKVSESIQLVDGLEWNPSLAMASGKDRVLLGVCRRCRSRRVLPWSRRGHGLCSAKNLKICADCGTSGLCPRHRKKSRIDNRYRCPRCHSWHRLKYLIRPLFFRRVER